MSVTGELQQPFSPACGQLLDHCRTQDARLGGPLAWSSRDLPTLRQCLGVSAWTSSVLQKDRLYLAGLPRSLLFFPLEALQLDILPSSCPTCFLQLSIEKQRPGFHHVWLQTDTANPRNVCPWCICWAAPEKAKLEDMGWTRKVSSLINQMSLGFTSSAQARISFWCCCELCVCMGAFPSMCTPACKWMYVCKETIQKIHHWTPRCLLPVKEVLVFNIRWESQEVVIDRFHWLISPRYWGYSTSEVQLTITLTYNWLNRAEH